TASHASRSGTHYSASTVSAVVHGSRLAPGQAPGSAGMTISPPRPARFALPHGERAWRAFAIQAVVLVLIAAFLAWVASNVVTNIARLNINTGFSFLARPAGFEISQKLIDFGEAASYFD